MTRWITISNTESGGIVFECHRCGSSYEPRLPCQIPMFDAMGSQFQRDHEGCAQNNFRRWRRSVRNLPTTEPLRSRHWTAYKALLVDLEWEGVLTKEEWVERRQKLHRTISTHQGGKQCVGSSAL